VACFDTQSPLLLQRCEDRAGELTGGICLLDCEAGAACGSERACDEGACVPAARAADASASDPPSNEPPPDAGASDQPSNRPPPPNVDDFDDVSDGVEWDMPIQSPPLSSAIAGGARIVGLWLEMGCGLPQTKARWGCMRLEVTADTSGEVTGTVQFDSPQSSFGPFPPAQDPGVGYPTADPSIYIALAEGLSNVPYRILDGRFENDRFTFKWSPYDLWHEWCGLQTPYRWTIGDHAFSFCVPQDRAQWEGIDEGKIVLCTSAAFEPLCTDSSEATWPCLCQTGAPNPRCSSNYCQCDDASCDANVRLGVHVELMLQGDDMTGSFSGGGENWTGTLRRVSP
jgi:hypothetical protein